VPQPSLLRTHPPAEERVARLLALDSPPAADPLVIVERPMMSLVGMGPATLRPRYRWPGLWY
jgi:heat shock protein HtpX